MSAVLTFSLIKGFVQPSAAEDKTNGIPVDWLKFFESLIFIARCKNGAYSLDSLLFQVYSEVIYQAEQSQNYGWWQYNLFLTISLVISLCIKIFHRSDPMI